MIMIGFVTVCGSEIWPLWVWSIQWWSPWYSPACHFGCHTMITRFSSLLLTMSWTMCVVPGRCSLYHHRIVTGGGCWTNGGAGWWYDSTSTTASPGHSTTASCTAGMDEAEWTPRSAPEILPMSPIVNITSSSILEIAHHTCTHTIYRCFWYWESLTSWIINTMNLIMQKMTKE